jgi:hypothetical protein
MTAWSLGGPRTRKGSEGLALGGWQGLGGSGGVGRGVRQFRGRRRIGCARLGWRGYGSRPFVELEAPPGCAARDENMMVVKEPGRFDQQQFSENGVSAHVRAESLQTIRMTMSMSRQVEFSFQRMGLLPQLDRLHIEQ